ncbi:MAG: hypothetical protein LBC09_07305, partial [Helicobacteraceae bacterium]|nr:hypothetical protein [Helicobacteraceae bacterium]
SRFYSKLIRFIRSRKALALKTKGKVWTDKINKLYSHLRHPKDVRKGNFYSYARRAEKAFMSSSFFSKDEIGVKRQLRKHMSIIKRELKQPTI